jgi:hypothetical protein
MKTTRLTNNRVLDLSVKWKNAKHMHQEVALRRLSEGSDKINGESEPGQQDESQVRSSAVNRRMFRLLICEIQYCESEHRGINV